MEPAQPTLTQPALLQPRLKAFLDRRLFASLATVDPDGAPRQAVIWYRLEDDGRIMVNSLAGRRWPANLERDPRVAISIVDNDDGYAWLGLTGRVDEIDENPERAREDIVALAFRYRDDPTPASIANFRTQRRITFRIQIQGIHDHLED
jgi:PPOX class probable F420-dependent enzyme